MKKRAETKKTKTLPSAYIENSGVVVDEFITDTLEKNYMPYAMSVIISRALPEIDGFKPSHRKLLYTMYKMGLLGNTRTKSANVVGQTMRLNPHGDGAIYETMVRLAKGNEALLHPFVDSKGNFGKFYSRDMAYAASRYTEVKLDVICQEIFADIDKETVDFIPNYDNSTTEPRLLPTTFPTILVNSNTGIAVSMASAICPFNLEEICETCIAIIKNPNHDILETLGGADFPTGGFLLKDEDEFRRIYETGRGTFKVRAKWNYDKTANCIEVTEIPYSTTIEAIIEKIIDLIKQSKLKEISYIRDETDLSGLKIAIDLKRGVDPDKLMQRLYKMTPLQDNYSCNFNILINGMPRVMGVREIINEWLIFRETCVEKRLKFDLQKKSEKLHYLKGLEKILLDIDKAIRVIRETKQETLVIPNLCDAFLIDQIQAEYVADIKLRNLNEEYILRRIADIEQLTKEIAEIKDILSDKSKIRKIIITELKGVIKQYKQKRKTDYYSNDEQEAEIIEEIPNYPVTIFLTKEGYFKKITPQSLRMNSEHKLKDGDAISKIAEITNNTDLIFFTDKQQAYKCKAQNFDDTKASVLGDYVPAKLQFDEGENVVGMVITNDYSENIVFAFKNGKFAKVPLCAYETKTNRRKLQNAYSDVSPLIGLIYFADDIDLLVHSVNDKALIFNTSLIALKSTKNTLGVQVITLKGKNTVDFVRKTNEEDDYKKYKVNRIPVAGSHMIRQLPLES
ncbi:DNA gyrase subunit A [Clostridia bacterium]|nr:DNA gyrase subunit A [Clostridia bacterium]